MKKALHTIGKIAGGIGIVIASPILVPAIIIMSVLKRNKYK